ncbi:MAG: cell division ATP-binding protein FtsE [Patescibacteria group bacterium]
MITFDNVTKSFGSIKALEGISLEVKNGEFVFLTGPSGAGKSTVLKMILREVLPDSGKVLFEGKNVAEITTKEVPFLRQQMGIVFQDFKVLFERTVAENVEVALAVSDVAQDEWEKRVKHVLKLVGLSNRAKLFPSQLSGGELQRVSLARALVINPKLILADEPTGNLDWKTAEGIMDLLEKINKEGKTVIMATHHEGIIKNSKHRVIELKDGRIIEN